MTSRGKDKNLDARPASFEKEVIKLKKENNLLRSEMKNAELNLRKFQHAIEQSPVSVVITDTWGNIEYVNKKFCEITGYALEEVIGKNPRILKSGETPLSNYSEMWDMISSGKEWHGVFLNKKKTGELYWESAYISPIKNENGSITNYIGVKEDITDKKNAEEKIKKAMEKAEELSRLKSNFLANMSHELRIPMVGILGFTELLGREVKDTAHKEMIDSIGSSGKRLMETLNLILDLSRVESNKQELNMKPLNIFKQAAEAVRLFTPVAASKNIELNISASEGGIISILDERIFYSIVVNLLNNALKYTFKGRIDVLISKQKTGADVFSVIHIKDTGIGIKQDRIAIIFDEYRQGSEGHGRLFEGTGLGLTITKKYIELMNGTISVKSAYGKGSTFIVKFPAYADSEKNAEMIEINSDGDDNLVDSFQDIDFENQSFRENNCNILVVDDYKSTHDILKVFLRGIGKPDFVFTGEEALMIAGMKQYRLVLLDISLGKGLNGNETLEKMKKMKGYSETPIVAMTAYAMVGDEEKFIREGFTHYISKPFSLSEFRYTVKKILGIK